MKVAAVFWRLKRDEGGIYTFGDAVFDALRELAPTTHHTFVHYVATGRRASPSALAHALPQSRLARYRRAMTYALGDLFDHANVTRGRARTPFERSLAAHGVDVVWFATNYVERCDRPFVLTMFDIEHARQPWFPEVSAGGEWTRRERHYARYLPRASRIIVPNEAGKEQVVHHYRLNADLVVCIGHPTPSFASAAAARPRLPRSRVERLGLRRRYLFYPAQFWAHKNHATLFDALAKLAASDGDPYELALVGSDKGQLAHARNLARRAGVEELVHFLGFVDTDDLIALYQHAHALTYVSFFGPENLPPLEAFALGCPVIAADIPGAAEQLGDAAILVPPLESDLIAQAVLRLENKELRERLVHLGQERARLRTPDAYVREVFSLLDDFERTRRCWA